MITKLETQIITNPVLWTECDRKGSKCCGRKVANCRQQADCRFMVTLW
jgi:hypothetical protein